MDHDAVLNAMDNARRALSDTAFRQTSSLLGEEKARLRELIQMKTAPEISAVIRKLRAEQEISADDLALVRLWVIGDAEGYLQMENNLQRWLEEFDAARASLERLGTPTNVAAMVKCQGLLEEANRLAVDIANLLEKKERIANFEQSTRDPANLNRGVLAAVLSRKLESDQI